MTRRLHMGLAALLVAGCAGHTPAAKTPWTPLGSIGALSAEYRAFLDRGRTCSRVVDFTVSRAKQFRVVDVHAVTAPKARPGDRLVFIDRGRTAIFVVVGKQPLVRAGARVIGAHIDTPSPRLAVVRVDPDKQAVLKAVPYGGMRWHHWAHLPLALVGRVAKHGGKEIDVELGLHDDFALYIAKSGRRLLVTLSSTPHKDWPGMEPTALVTELHRRYGLTAADLEASELYLVPKHRARDVGVDRALVGAHGQDDRVNSYAAWRAVIDVAATPRSTAMAWLVDREEVGSTHAIGARSRFLELVYAWLIRAGGTRVTEAALARAFARSTVVSADTPAAINPNWQQVQEPLNAPAVGSGPALFPHTGRGGKSGGNQAHAERVRALVDAFARAGVPLQFGELGRVDEGGGGTIAKYLAQRGADVVDVGVAVISMHSPMEVSAKVDIWSAYRGFRQWLQQ